MASNYWSRMRARRVSRRTMLKASGAAGVGVAGIALVGCGGDDDDDDAAPAPAPAAAAAEEQADEQAEQVMDDAEDQAEEQAMADEPAEEESMSGAPMGGTLRRGNTSTPNFVRLGLNNAGNNTGYNQDGSIYERIARVGASGLTRQDEVGPNFHRATEFDYAIQPVLATGWETPDDVTWVINSRTDPVWHTGRSFDAEDITWVLNEIQDENAGGGGSPMHLMAQNIDSVETVDAASVRMALTKPTGYIETLLEQTNIVDRETYDQRIDEAVVVGTGPYQFTNYDPNRGWDQIPHPDFASENPHSVYSGGQPLLDKIEHILFADVNAMGLALEAGEIDTHRGVPIGVPEIGERLLADEDFFKVSGYGLGGRVLRFRADSEPFRNKLARQAVLMLADGPRIQRDFFGPFDVAGRMPWQPGSPAFVADLDPHPIAVDPEGTRAEAGRLFEAAGFSGGEVLKMDILPERLDAPATAQLLQQEVAAFGIETEITPREYTEMITLQTTGTFDHMIIGFGNWVRPGSPAVTVLFADAYDGRMNAPVDENVPLLERPGIADEPEWTSMVQAAIDGTWDDWQAWNEKYLDVAWSNCLVRQYALLSENSARAGLTHPDDAYGWAYAPGYHIVS